MLESPVNVRGYAVAEILTGAWRRSQGTFEGSAKTLETICPLLQRSGAAALAWWRVRESNLRATPVANELHQTYRFNTLQSARKELKIAQVVGQLRFAGVEPILVKGWAVAPLYPEEGLRPYGDIDLCVRPRDYSSAMSVLLDLGVPQYEVDLHRGFDKFGGGELEGFFDRSKLVQLDETTVRVLGAEDNLRVLCVHMLREGAWRALWLCDIAAAVESRSPDFDWDRCLTENGRLADWVICGLRLAHELLGANISDTPAANANRPLPSWLVSTILKEWESPLPSMSQRHLGPMAMLIRSRTSLWNGIRNRWPNPIEATVTVGGRFNNVTRLPYQLANCVARTAKFAASLRRSSR